MMSLLSSVLLLNVFYSAVSSLYFHIGETEKKCFIEEIPDETRIIGNYRTQLYDKHKEEYLPATQGLGMFVEVKDPDEKVILSRQYGSEGRFTFTSHTPGEHQICLHSNSSKFSLFAGGMLRVHLDIQVGEHANNYAAKDKLTELQLRVRQLVEQVDQIQKEQNYQRYQEERFRQTSESTNQRVLWWSIVQANILVAIGILQMLHLKSFFEAKKLVYGGQDCSDWQSAKDSGRGESEAGDVDWDPGRDSPVDPQLDEGLNNLLNNADDVFSEVDDPDWITADYYNNHGFTPNGPPSPEGFLPRDVLDSSSSFSKTREKDGPLGGALLSKVSTLFEKLLRQKADAHPGSPLPDVLYRLSAAYRRSLGLDGGITTVAANVPMCGPAHRAAPLTWNSGKD